MILDELPTLHQVPSLQPGLAESRQFGGCFVLGVQVASALRDLYGRNGAETISGLCGTRVVLAAPDRDTAQWSADSLGRSEVEEVTEGYSYGANTIRDGVSLTPRRELRALALPSEIMRLPNLEGYLKFPGPFPVASIRLKYVARPAAAERFVPRKEGGAESRDRPDDVPNRNGGDSAAIGEPDSAANAAMEAAETGGATIDLPPLQGELELLPRPDGPRDGEAGRAPAGPAEKATGVAPPSDDGVAAPARSGPGPDPQDAPAGGAATDAGRTPGWI